MRSMGYTVIEQLGKYEQPGRMGYGVAAVLKNGPGPTLMIRTDMDALPVEEKTGLPYASKVKTKNEAGVEVSVMHACGHDLHMASFLGTAKILSELKEQWSGTIVFVGQPAEETTTGARALLRDGLYTKVPQPDYVIALHDTPDFPVGSVAAISGYAMASSTSIDIKIRGLGGHGSRPETTKDPIVVAAQVILALQTIVSRENSPFDPAVVTVGSIHGGAKHNIIPDEVNLQLTVRTYKEDVRKRVLASIERVTKGAATAAGIPPDRAPIVQVNEGEATAALYNDPALTERVSKALTRVLGAERVLKADPIMASEDFGYFGLERKIPTTLFWLGASDPEKLKAAKESGTQMPSLHSPLFAPVPEPALRAGVKAMTSVALELLSK
jgi:hippurate hydrolase